MEFGDRTSKIMIGHLGEIFKDQVTQTEDTRLEIKLPSPAYEQEQTITIQQHDTDRASAMICVLRALPTENPRAGQFYAKVVEVNGQLFGSRVFTDGHGIFYGRDIQRETDESEREFAERTAYGTAQTLEESPAIQRQLLELF